MKSSCVNLKYLSHLIKDYTRRTVSKKCANGFSIRLEKKFRQDCQRQSHLSNFGFRLFYRVTETNAKVTALLFITV